MAGLGRCREDAAKSDAEESTIGDDGDDGSVLVGALLVGAFLVEIDAEGEPGDRWKTASATHFIGEWAGEGSGEEGRTMSPS